SIRRRKRKLRASSAALVVGRRARHHRQRKRRERDREEAPSAAHGPHSQVPLAAPQVQFVWGVTEGHTLPARTQPRQGTVATTGMVGQSGKSTEKCTVSSGVPWIVSSQT